MIVVDTNIWDAALRSPTGASHAILRGVLAGEVAAGASTALFLEYEEVLKREDHLAAFGLDRGQVDIILTALAKQLTPVPIRYRCRPVLPDPKDDLVLEAAANGGAQAVITFNRRDFKGAQAFGIGILQPRDFVWRLKQ